MTTVPLRVGLVGCGRLAEVGYLPALGRTGDLRLVAVADPDDRRRRRLATLAGDAARGPLASFASADELVRGIDVDAVILASPASTHLDDATAATAAGAAVLVEKPPAPDTAGAAHLAALDPPPRIGFNRRFDPAVRDLRDRVPAHGELVLDLCIHYRRQSWGAHAVADDVLIDLGPHLIDWARWLTGSEVVAVRADAISHDRATVELELERGRARLQAAADRLHREAIEVRDDTGSLVARHRVGGPVAAVTGRLAAGPHPLVVSLAGQLDAFARAARGQDAPDLGTATDGIAVLSTIDAARASAADRGRTRPVAVPTRS